MDHISLYNTGWGSIAMAGQIAADNTQKHFVYEQKHREIITVSATSGKVGLSFRFGAYNQTAKVLYAMAPLRGAWTTVYVTWATSNIVTAGLLKTAIEAELSGSPEISVTDNGNGTLTINGLIVGMMMQTKSLVQCSKTVVLKTFDLDSYSGNVYLIGVCTGGKIRYEERTITGSPSATVGMQVIDGGSFTIYGREGIRQATFVEDTVNAVVDYGIFI